MSEETERESGGLVALTVEEADRLVDWALSVEVNDQWYQEDETLRDRLMTWRDRHTPEDAS